MLTTKTELIRVYGTVQGVGFRPTVCRLAKSYGLFGDVCNDGEGVLIRVLGNESEITDFLKKLWQECPPLGRIIKITRQPYQGELKCDNFVITQSFNSQVKTTIPPDTATCPKCQEEIFSPYSRYYRYPFTNCTHCGPRFSIIDALPYDRYSTSMGAFSMCEECCKEYKNIENRRFHAQPIACHTCGPKAWLERADGKPVTAYMFSMLDDMDAVCTLLQKGEIVAIKGIGGFHLACDATNNTAVQKLRERKRRRRKPFAIMARDTNIIKQYCYVSLQEEELLVSSAAPIVLLQAKQFQPIHTTINKKLEIHPLSCLIAPGQNSLGFILPYTPLHHLIFRRIHQPIVLTSGNISDYPQCIDNDEAKEKLSKVADYFVFHNRDIVNRVDDSVVRVVNNKLQTLRRSRGYIPEPINLPPGFTNIPQVLAMGGELKNTFCLLKNGQAILSQHLGNLEHVAAFDTYQETLKLYLNLFEHQPQVIAVDKHPDYLASKQGSKMAVANQISIEYIQHHHAHIAACMVENHIPLNSPPILGIVFDGLGYGEDGTLWGGEFMLATYQQFQRLATFKPIPMIGGEKAIKEPWRNAYSHLISALGWDKLTHRYGELAILKVLKSKPLTLLNLAIEKQINSPLTSSVGRLFDAVAATIGICSEEISYEGEAAIEIEALAQNHISSNSEEKRSYVFTTKVLDKMLHIDSRPMWQSLLDDLQNQVPIGVIAAKFHNGLVKIIVKLAEHLCQEYTVTKVAFTGGVFQNSILLERVKTGLESMGINVIDHSLIPPNDGGLSLGQAIIAAAKFIKSR